MSEFDEYIRQGEPGRKEKAQAWQTAIGLQDVDGLKPSPYLIDTAKKHIEGDITIKDVKDMLDSYYKSKSSRQEMEERTEFFSKCKICTLNCTLEELAVLNYLHENPHATQKELARHIHRSERTVKSITVKLQNNDCLARKNGRRDGYWEVKIDL